LPAIDGNIPHYVQYYRNELTELLTNYGKISEVWFDGAKGGDSKLCYYGGVNGDIGVGRSVDES
jgi:alpha-L-fucosidase